MSETTDTKTISGGAVLRGGAVGLAVIVPASVILAVIDAMVDEPGVRRGLSALLVVVLFVAYVIAGWRAGREEPLAPLSNGALAALLALAFWIPVRIAIFVVRGEDRDLFGDDDPVFRIGQLLGQAVIALVLGMVGGLLASAQARRRAAAEE